MVIVRLKGGLGNQMFQYAFASILAYENNVPLKIDTSFFSENNNQLTTRNYTLGAFNLNHKIASKSELKKYFKASIFNKVKRKIGLSYPRIFIDNSLAFNKSALDLKAPIYLEGYFQSYKYFSKHEKFVKDLFSFQKIQPSDENLLLLNKIRKTSSVSVHIRRGDYVSNSKAYEFHGICPKEYYLQAIETLLNLDLEPVLFFFSDDMEWVKQNFNDLPFNKTFVEINERENSWKDLMLMNNCKYNILANSSFSWWGAYLNSGSTVIAPKNWYSNTKANQNVNDLLPKEWIKL